MDLEHYQKVHDRFSIACLYLISSRPIHERLLKAYRRIIDVNTENLPIHSKNKISYLVTLCSGETEGQDDAVEKSIKTLSEKQAQDAAELIFSIFIDIVESGCDE